jgi:tRNA A-37 threonylcarbamoyl transferase component Bud32
VAIATYRTWVTEGKSELAPSRAASVSVAPPELPPARRDSRRDARRFEPGAMMGSYKLLATIGEGAMGRVYLGEHQRLGRRVAVKVLHPGLATRRSAVTRFCREARILTKIRHPNIVRVLDLVEHTGEPPYMVMELLAGRPLRDVMRAGAALSSLRVIDIGIQLCSALEVCHAIGVVHRDLAPGNIFVCDDRSRDDGWLKLLDFGIAKLNDEEAKLDGWTHVTASGAIVGTPGYMSPEQAAGQPAEPRSDLYSLGTILYELAAGQPAATGKTLTDYVRAHLMDTPPRVRETFQGRDVAPALDDMIMRCLAKRLADRPPSAVTLRRELIALRTSLTGRKRSLRHVKAGLALAVPTFALAATVAHLVHGAGVGQRTPLAPLTSSVASLAGPIRPATLDAPVAEPTGACEGVTPAPPVAFAGLARLGGEPVAGAVPVRGPGTRRRRASLDERSGAVLQPTRKASARRGRARDDGEVDSEPDIQIDEEPADDERIARRRRVEPTETMDPFDGRSRR